MRHPPLISLHQLQTFKQDLVRVMGERRIESDSYWLKTANLKVNRNKRAVRRKKRGKREWCIQKEWEDERPNSGKKKNRKKNRGKNIRWPSWDQSNSELSDTWSEILELQERGLNQMRKKTNSMFFKNEFINYGPGEIKERAIASASKQFLLGFRSIRASLILLLHHYKKVT